VCGTKNFSSVRLYSAPQVLHRTIVTIPGICAFGEQDQAGSFAAIKSDPLSGLGRSTSLDRQAAGSMWDAYCSTTRAKSAIVFSLMVDGSGSRGCHINAQRGAAGKSLYGWGSEHTTVRCASGMLMSLSNAQGKITPYKWVHPEEER
jgi:hypothetical protein